MPAHRRQPGLAWAGNRVKRRRPALLSPDGVPVRWLLTDGYVYDIRDDQDHPPWQEGRHRGSAQREAAVDPAGSPRGSPKERSDDAAVLRWPASWQENAAPVTWQAAR